MPGGRTVFNKNRLRAKHSLVPVKPLSLRACLNQLLPSLIGVGLLYYCYDTIDPVVTLCADNIHVHVVAPVVDALWFVASPHPGNQDYFHTSTWKAVPAESLASQQEQAPSDPIECLDESGGGVTEYKSSSALGTPSSPSSPAGHNPSCEK